MALSDGIYRVVTARDNNVCFDCYGGGAAQGTNVQLWCVNDGSTNNQIFKLTTDTDGYSSLANVVSGNLIDIYNPGTITAGCNIQLWPKNDGSTGNQLWKLIDSGKTVTRNGNSCALYQMQSKNRTSLYADAYGGSSTMGTNMQVWTLNDQSTLNQCFDFVKDSAFSPSIGTPSAVKMRSGTADETVAGQTASTTYYPSWWGTSGTHQVRYRTRTRSASMDVSGRGSWSAWKSIADGTTTDDGWGDAWAGNCTPTASGSRMVSLNGVAVDVSTGTTDLEEIEFEVRRFEASYGDGAIATHGGSASVVCRVARQAVIAVDGTVAWGIAGLFVPLKSGLARGGNTVRCRVRGVTDWVTESNQGASCTIEFTGEHLKSMPREGDALTIDVEWTTADGLQTSKHGMSATCSWQADHGLSFAAQTNVADGLTLDVKTGDHATERLWIVTPVGVTEVTGDGKGNFSGVPCPLNTEFEMFAMAQDSDTKWGTWSGEYRPVDYNGCMFNFDKTDGFTWASVRFGFGDEPSLSRDVSPDSDTLQRAGGGHDVVRFGGAVSETIKLSGALVWELGDSLERFDALSRCKWAWFRDPEGHVWRVAVTGASVSRKTKGGAEVSVDMVVVDGG